MPSLKRFGLEDVLAGLPQNADLGPIISRIEVIDLLVVVSGFEPRVDAVAIAIEEAGTAVRRACYFTYEANPDENAVSREKLLRPLREIAEDIETLSADCEEEELITRLQEIVASAAREDEEPPVVVVDISVASSRLVARCMHVLVHADVRLVVAYAQADFYYPSEQQYAEWRTRRDELAKQAADALDSEPRYDLGPTPDTTLGLDHGAKAVEYLKDFRVQHLDALPDRVIVLPAYNGARARLFLAQIDSALLENHPNDAVTWLVGDPLRPEDKWRFEALAAANSLVNPDGTAHACAVPLTTFEYIDAIRALGSIYEQGFGREKVTICAMGSKMQNLGALLFCEMHPDVRLGQAIPERYTPTPYSEGVAALWGIDFGPTAELNELLGKYGTAQIVDE